MKPKIFGWIMTSLTVCSIAAQATPCATYRLDAVQSKIEVGVFSGGALGILGHDHIISAKRFSGTITCDTARLGDSSVSLNIDSKSLTVVDPNASEKDRREVQSTMESPKVLDVNAFPEITFRSTGIGDLKQTGKGWEGNLVGILRIHGHERLVAIPIHILVENNRLNARGEVFINQKDFGIAPISLAAGTVRVKDRVKITFMIVAEIE